MVTTHQSIWLCPPVEKRIGLGRGGEDIGKADVWIEDRGRGRCEGCLDGMEAFCFSKITFLSRLNGWAS